MTTARAVVTRSISEAAFQAQVVQTAELFGWSTFHVHDMRRSVPGWPDLVLVRERVLFRELKTDRGRVTPEQQYWLDRLTAAGQDAGLWRPSDWETIVEVLK